MAEGVLSFPFQLGPDGSAVVVGYGTDAEVEQAIGVLTLTHLGERPMVPTFGVPDPAFAGLHPGDIQVGLNEFGPEDVTITNITATPVTESMSQASIEWTRDTEMTST